MKLLGSVLAILILIISGGIWLDHELQNSSKVLTAQMDLVSIEIADNNWSMAVTETEKLEKTWKKEAKWWPVFLEHQEMDNIEFAMARFKEYVATNDNPLAMGQLSEIRLMVEHIPRKEKINLENIL